ncbi:MAG TPA: glycosyltransferase family 4 protein [Saprospiraceae bacterium]|nr:glycosyltransferase family 4 protein [Saprospiraceae bacterium]
MTILYIGNHLSSNSNGGYPSVAESLAPHLLPEVQLHLVSRQRNRLRRLAEMLWAVWKYGRQEQPVVIDVYSTLNFYYALLCGMLCRLKNIPYLCILHGGNLPSRLLHNPRLCRYLFGHAHKLIAPSGYLQASFRDAGYETEVIPNFIPITNYPFKKRRQLQARLLWVRAFDETYHPQMAIRVLHQLSKQFPDANLCMVGPDKDGSMENCQRLANELEISDKITFTGRLSKAEWISLSSDYDLFISTTNFDNMPVSVIEAMALGLPVVSTNVGGVPYLIEHEKTGLLVPPNDVEEMVRAITKLINNNAIAESLSQAARQKAEQYDWEVIRPRWIELLERI